jgi:hypothetical protein
MEKSFTLSIDGQEYIAFFTKYFLDGDNIITLGDIDNSCLELMYSESLEISSVNSSRTCHIYPPLPRKKTLDILIPFAIEIGLLFRQNIWLQDTAFILIGSEQVFLSPLKIMLGIPSTTYSKYGFIENGMTNNDYINQSLFFRTTRGIDTSLETQKFLVDMNLDLSKTLSDIVGDMISRGMGYHINIFYKKFFDHPLSDQIYELNLDKWLLYKQRHNIILSD